MTAALAGGRGRSVHYAAVMKARPRNAGDTLPIYLRDIGKIPVLTREEELLLARKAAQGDHGAHDALVTANLRFVVMIAKRYANRGLSLEDLIDEGNLGLINAIRHFDPERGNRFITYAIWWIRQSLIRALRHESGHDDGNRGWVPPTVSLDSPVSCEEGSALLGELIADTGCGGPEDMVVHDSLKTEVDALLCRLPERESRVIRERFGLDGSRPASLEEIGKELHMTRERVRQIERRALRRIRHCGGGERLGAYAS